MRKSGISMLLSMLIVILPVVIVQFPSLFKIVPFTGTETKTNHKNE